MDAAQCSRDGAKCAAMLNALSATVSSLNNTLQELQAASLDPCAEEGGSYDVGLHVVAIFVVLVASLLGVCSTLLGKHWSLLRLNPFIIMLGKAAGTGVVISCGFVHMLLPSHESLTSPCVPEALSTEYGAYAYLLAMVAALALHHLELAMAQWFAGSAASCNHHRTIPHPPPLPPPHHLGPHYLGQQYRLEVVQENLEVAVVAQEAPDEDKAMAANRDGETLTSAVMAEFAFSVHSVFIGLAVGIVSDESMKALLTALCFHQLFEGVSLGARLAEAKLPQWTDWAMAVTFAVSAPVGIAIVVGLVAASDSFNSAGPSFLITQGVFDGLCAGILIYIGFSMLIRDIPSDLDTCSRQPYPGARKFLLLLTLWTGMGMMALIGKYL